MHTVYNWEAGRVRIPKARVQAITNCLETSPRVLVAVLVAGPSAGAAPASDDSPLRLARRAAGLSVAGLAAEVGSSACSVRRWELGRRAPQVRDQATRRCIRNGLNAAAALVGVPVPDDVRTGAWRHGPLRVAAPPRVGRNVSD